MVHEMFEGRRKVVGYCVARFVLELRKIEWERLSTLAYDYFC